MSFGQFLRMVREQLGLTQDLLAALASISKPYLSNLETGRAKNPPTDQVLLKLEKALKVEPGRLMWMGHMARTPADVRAEFEAMLLKLRKLVAIFRILLASRPEAGWPELDELAKDPTLQELLNDATGYRRTGPTVPVVNTVATGYPSMTDLDSPPGPVDEYVRCLDVDDPQAFAIRVVGDLMEPRYSQGDVVVFAPGTMPRDGNDCFVRFSDGCSTFQRFYQDAQDAIRLQPLNNRYPARTYRRDQITGLWPAVVRIERLRN